MALPTANKKEGNTKSVGVKPCQCACNKGAYVVALLPVVFTIIIRQIVIPLKTSRAVNRWLPAVIFYWFWKNNLVILIKTGKERIIKVPVFK